jgi:anti-sigma B factor antagonist
MDLTTEKNGTELTIHLSGELNTTTAPQLSDLIDKELNGVQTLFMDFAECDYVSSAGLRVLLATFKKMQATKGNMSLINVGPTFMDVLEITGMSNVFDIN